MRTLFLCCLSFSLYVSIQAQDMQEGFNLLETGKNQEAQVFFERVLEEFPQNKTAQLCYARALGLGGNPSEALGLFKNMLSEYPGDLEITLNYAEAFLWNNRFEEAAPIYKNLVSEYPENFGTLLGYANTLSNLKKYPKALTYISKALAIDPENLSAKTSQKYIRLGYAAQLSKAGKAILAQTYLDSNFIDFPKDRDTQLNKISIYLATNNYEQVASIYENFNQTKEEQIEGTIGLALVSHLQENDKKALAYALEAKKQSASVTDSTLVLAAAERYTQALIWNAKYTEAKRELKHLDSVYKSNSKVLALNAMFGMYTGDFKKAITAYQTILAKDSTSFDGNLGIANAYRAADDPQKAYHYAKQTLNYYEDQKDAQGLVEALDLEYAPTVDAMACTTKDNGENIAYSYGVATTIPLSTALKVSANYGYRITRNALSGQEAQSYQLGSQVHYRLTPGYALEAQAGLIKAITTDKEYTDVQGALTFKTKPVKRLHLDLGYRRALQNFNAALLEEKIALNDYFVNYNWGLTTRLGWYTSMIYTAQSDANNRKLLFTSLYYSLTRKPALKMGFNYQNLSYKNQVSELYFSPKQYQAAEVFADLMLKVGDHFSIHSVAAGGLQYVEDQEATSIFRAELNATYSINKQFQLGCYGKYSNIASAVASGFEFGELGFKLRWIPSAKPLFRQTAK
ncbi:tetratricopeptide repeat protein [Leeuwenhoekiella sp. ZYFB001]|uniref:tetratricopeptide repeat protein n=1 Tax=Leeuwenhoekiella sp. ZYFB001 TaxID=2719912 RepID=UPI00142F7109|nr:tetratricopeptide repeat protein [Leeuwenhoekiella sp. ZYFB001]